MSHVHQITANGRLITIVASLGWVWFCYLFSLFRTPWRKLWALTTLFSSVVIAIAGVGLPHVTVLGLMVACGIGFGAVIWFGALCTEITAADAPRSEIRRYRADHPLLNMGHLQLRKPKPEPYWRVDIVHSQHDHRVVISIRSKDGKSRPVGTTDPVEDWDEFLNLKLQAEEMRDTYNGLGVM